MSDIRIQIASGTTRRLLTGGKYCPNNIIIEALSPKLVPLTAQENGSYNPADYNSADGFSSVEVDVHTREKPSGTLTIKKTIESDTTFTEPVTKDNGETAYEAVEVQLTLAEGLIIPSQIKNISVYASNIDVYDCKTVNITIPKYNNEIENIITFYYAIDVYEAIEGMTWYEWLNSDMASGTFSCVGPDHPVYVDNGEYTIGDSHNPVSGNDLIINRETYIRL